MSVGGAYAPAKDTTHGTRAAGVCDTYSHVHVYILHCRRVLHLSGIYHLTRLFGYSVPPSSSAGMLVFLSAWVSATHPGEVSIARGGARGPSQQREEHRGEHGARPPLLHVHAPVAVAVRDPPNRVAQDRDQNKIACAYFMRTATRGDQGHPQSLCFGVPKLVCMRP